MENVLKSLRIVTRTFEFPIFAKYFTESLFCLQVQAQFIRIFSKACRKSFALSYLRAGFTFKALLIKKTGKFPKIHDLVKLGKDVEIPDSYMDGIKELTFAYAYTRYPDVENISNIEEKTTKFLKLTKEILKWVEKNL